MTATIWMILGFYVAAMTLVQTGSALLLAANEGNALRAPGLAAVGGGFLLLLSVTVALAIAG